MRHDSTIHYADRKFNKNCNNVVIVVYIYYLRYPNPDNILEEMVVGRRGR